MKQKPDAKEIRTLRSGRNQAGTNKVKRIRHLHGSDEAETVGPQVQIKQLGSYGLVKAPALHAERDILFDKYLRAYDNYHRWMNQEVQTYCTNYGKDDKYKRANLYAVLKRHLDELSEQLQRYDERINAATTTGPLFY